jgi:hypothetical protein
MRNISLLFTWLIFSSLSATAQNKFVPFNNAKIVYEGRVQFVKDAALLMWTGTTIHLNFSGTECVATFKDADTSNYYTIIVDDTIKKIMHFDTVKANYTLATALQQGKHSIKIYKRTEWDKGKTFFYGLQLSAKTTLLAPPILPKRKIEFFGNSITCGYAIEDVVNDSHIGFFENGYNAYAAITARHFNAQAHITAKSGIGIMISWFPLLMKEMYNRLDATDSTSKWNFKKYTPNIVVINLFQNDSWLVNMPEHEQFKYRFGTVAPTRAQLIQEYKSFVSTVRKVYPKANIICMLGNMDITKKGSVWPSYVEQAVQQLHDGNMFTLFVPYKETPGHPKTNEQQLLANTLIEFIEKNINW